MSYKLILPLLLALVACDDINSSVNSTEDINSSEAKIKTDNDPHQYQSLQAIPQLDSTEQEACKRSVMINFQDFDSTTYKLSFLFSNGNFEQFETESICLLNATQRFSNGKMGAAAVYWALRKEMPAPGVDASYQEHIQQWRKQRPQSNLALFAALRFNYALAWNQRGKGLAREVPDGDWVSYEQGLRKVQQDILDIPPEKRHHAIWQNLLLAVVMDVDNPQVHPDDVVREGVKHWPEYYDFYEVRLTRLVPRWGGNWKKIDTFIQYWAEQRQASEGDSLYARLYADVINREEEINDIINWSRMKNSMEQLYQKYPSVQHKNLAASYACVYADKEYYRMAHARILPIEFNQQYWFSFLHKSDCDKLLDTD